MKIQFSAVRSKLGYKKEDIIKSRFFYEGNYSFLILNHDYGDTISLKIIGYMTSVDFHRVNDVDNFILNNKRHIKFKQLDMNPPRELDIICTPKEEYKNATLYCTSTSNIFKILAADDSMFFINGFYYLVIETTNKPGYYLTFADEYVVLTDKEYNSKDDKLPGITLAKFPLPKEKLKNVLTFDSLEDVKSFFYKTMNFYTCNNDLPEEHTDIYIVLRYIIANIDRLMSSSQLLAFNRDLILLFKIEKYNDINEILLHRAKNIQGTNINFTYPLFSYLDKYYDRLKGDDK